jgi:hypothetical protein
MQKHVLLNFKFLLVIMKRICISCSTFSDVTKKKNMQMHELKSTGRYARGTIGFRSIKNVLPEFFSNQCNTLRIPLTLSLSRYLSLYLSPLSLSFSVPLSPQLYLLNNHSIITETF